MPTAPPHRFRWIAFLQPGLFAWALYLVMLPLYIFKSGLPQPGDVFVLVLIPIALRGWNGRLPKTAVTTLQPLLWLTFWVFVVNYGWAIILGNYGLFGADTFVLFPLYYLYNTLLFVVVLVLHQRYGDSFLRVTLYSTYLTVVVQVISSLLGASTSRGSVFFNNPNQLGYFALLVACLIVGLHWRLKLKLWTSTLALTCCGYMATVSASRAALASVAILFALLVFSNPKVIVAASLMAIALVFAGGPLASTIESTQERVKNRTSQRGFFADRGYDRIWQFKEHLVLGAGEGGFTRFAETRDRQIEVHSSVGTVVFSNGVVGLTLFVAFLWRLVRGAPLRLSLLLIPPLVYGMSHQGLRFSLLWVFLAILLALKTELLGTLKTRLTGGLTGAPRST